MMRLDTKAVVPVGCSCINQFQIQYFLKRIGNPGAAMSSFFDWNIISPYSTSQIIRALIAGEAKEIIATRRNYRLENGYLRNIAFEAVYFWHYPITSITEFDGDVFEDFVSKISYLLDNFMNNAFGDRRYHLWTNIQPNLKAAIALVDAKWDLFFLTESNYLEIAESLSSLFKDSRTMFVVRESDVDKRLIGADDVVILNLERSDDLLIYKGPENLYDPIFRKLCLV